MRLPARPRAQFELDRIEDALIQWRAEAFEDTFHYPVRLNNQLATIADLTNMASSAPTHQMLTLYASFKQGRMRSSTGWSTRRPRSARRSVTRW